MADTILGGDFTVTYLAENRQKRIEWTGSATGTRTLNELYSALQNLFDALNQMDDGVPFSAQTPTEYTVGIIDPGDGDPWFIDRTTAEHLTDGALKTASWLRAEGTNTGIVRMGYTETVALVAGDIGKTIVMTTDGDSGTLLDFNSTDLILWIRPDNDTAANSFNDAPTANGAWTITGGTGTGNQSGGASVSGESLWAGIFSIGTIASNTHLYVVQNGAVLTAYKASTDWWVDGQIDILVNVKEVDTEVDEAVITVLARRYSATYDNFETDLSAGGKNPIPLATGTDLDNANGYRQMVLTDSAGTFNVGDRILDDTDSTIEGVVTSVSGSNPTVTLQYYLIGDPLNDFTGSTGTFSSVEDDGTGTAVAPTNVGPAALTGTTIVHASNETFDIDENGSTENYSIVIDCNSVALAEVYEWTKYLTRRGGTTTGDTDGLAGEQYIGSTIKVVYVTETGTVSEGDVVTQVTSGATGTVVSHNRTDNIVILRNTRGTFNTADLIQETPAVNELVGAHVITVLTPIKQALFGTFAGGTWFCSPGVVLSNVPGADANNYQLIDDDGNVVLAPTKVTATVGNLRVLDAVALFRLTGAGGTIDKAEYAATVQAAGATTAVVGVSITADTPPAGAIRLVGDDEDREYRLRYSSFTGSTFTLSSTASLVADAGTNATTIIDAAGGFNTNAKVGDLIRNVTAAGIGYVVAVVSDTELTTTSISGQTTGDTYDINTLPIATTAADSVYVPLIDIIEDTGTDGSPGTEEAIVTFLANIEVRARVRQGGAILPFEGDGVVTTAGLTISAIRTADTIAT